MNNLLSLFGDEDDAASLSEPLSLAYLLGDDEDMKKEEEEKIPALSGHSVQQEHQVW